MPGASSSRSTNGRCAQNRTFGGYDTPPVDVIAQLARTRFGDVEVRRPGGRTVLIVATTSSPPGDRGTGAVKSEPRVGEPSPTRTRYPSWCTRGSTSSDSAGPWARRSSRSRRGPAGAPAGGERRRTRESDGADEVTDASGIAVGGVQTLRTANQPVELDLQGAKIADRATDAVGTVAQQSQHVATRRPSALA